MKVICINEDWRDDGKSYDFATPVFGSEQEVISCAYRERQDTTDPKHGTTFTSRAGVYYELRGFPGLEFHAMNFAILPDTDAEQINQEQKEAIINIETPLV